MEEQNIEFQVRHLSAVLSSVEHLLEQVDMDKQTRQCLLAYKQETTEKRQRWYNQCTHRVVDDYVDVSPDESVPIRYCEICLTTLTMTVTTTLTTT